MRQILCFAILAGFLMSCDVKTNVKRTNDELPEDEPANKAQIAMMLDSFNATAARADYSGYFTHFADNANTVFIGTDATEHWTKKEFMDWAKPYFDRGRVWKFTALGRNIYSRKESPGIAWFDELLNTSMKICRGSGVVVKEDGRWKVQQYVLSITVPNSLADSVVAIKTTDENKIIDSLTKKGR